VITLCQAINRALRAALEEDPRVLVMGEDVGVLGGVFRVTEGLQKDFGPARVVDTPLAEAGIVGTAIGLALRGYRPVCEIQFDGFVYPAFSQIVAQLAKMRARTLGALSLPVVIRIPVGGGIGAVEHHSESNEAYFAHTAGLRVLCCSNPLDAHRMLRQAIACDDPVIFYEPKRCYWDHGVFDDEDDDDVRTSVLPLDAAAILRTGHTATLIGYGGTIHTCLEAAEVAAAAGHELEVLDLRSLSPLDLETIVASVDRTGHCIVVHEAPVTGGLGGEITAQVTQRCFYRLEAPVLRVGGFDMPYPPARIEHSFLPSVDNVIRALDHSLAY
jgi:pyruvate dehydrogenase E1 component beta subunit